MTDPATIEQGLETTTASLDAVSKALWGTTEVLNEAEAEWEEKYDEIAASLKEDAVKEGSTRDPAEHTIIAATRRAHRPLWIRYQKAKREAKALETVSSNRRAELTGYQTQMRNLNSEAGVQDSFNQPSWSGQG